MSGNTAWETWSTTQTFWTWPTLRWHGVSALGIHTLAMLLVMFPIAMVVYKKVGLAFLRRGWINVDLFWAVALLLLGGVATLMLILI